MDVEAEKLLHLIENRSPIYNNKEKDHSNKIVIENMWTEIASEMKCQVSECKSKWRSLRNSYSRYLRDERTKPSGSSGKQKKKWYLSDAMSFLKDFINQQPSPSSNLDSPEVQDNVDEITHLNVPSKRSRTSISEMVAGPMVEFLQSRTRDNKPDDANELFFKSLLVDFEKLSSRRQRSFRLHMINLMNEMQEAEESDILKVECI